MASKLDWHKIQGLLIINKMKTITVNFGKWRSGLVVFFNLFYFVVLFSWPFLLGWSVLIVAVPVGLVLLFNAWKGWQEFTGKRVAIIIDKDGIVDNIHWYSLGRVEWEEVDAIKTKGVFFAKTIRVLFKNPSNVMQREKKFLKKIFQSFQLVLNRTPMILNTRTLAISHNELATLLRDIDFENPNFVDMSEHLID